MNFYLHYVMMPFVKEDGWRNLEPWCKDVKWGGGRGSKMSMVCFYSSFPRNRVLYLFFPRVQMQTLLVCLAVTLAILPYFHITECTCNEGVCVLTSLAQPIPYTTRTLWVLLDYHLFVHTKISFQIYCVSHCPVCINEWLSNGFQNTCLALHSRETAICKRSW